MKLSLANMAILKNMSDLMTRELWGAYQDSYKQRILQLKKVGPPACLVQHSAWLQGSDMPALRCSCLMSVLLETS